MSGEYIRPEKPHYTDDVPPQDIANLTSEQIRDPNRWSNDALFGMIRLKLDSVEEMVNILRKRAEDADIEARNILFLLINKKAENYVALE